MDYSTTIKNSKSNTINYQMLTIIPEGHIDQRQLITSTTKKITEQILVHVTSKKEIK